VFYIESKGIADKRISAKGYGKTKPIIADATTEEDHQKNRRTEFKVTKIEGAIPEKPAAPAPAPAAPKAKKGKGAAKPKAKKTAALDMPSYLPNYLTGFNPTDGGC
jgi:hypothetical protein